jgi:hypothetical protein
MDEQQLQTLSASAKERYNKLIHEREHFLERARECAELTIPALIPDESFNSSSDLYTPFQSVGARGVNNLASKLLLLLLPPNSPFFRLKIGGKAKQEIEQQPEVKTQVEKALADIEKEIASKIEELAIRVPVFEALKHLIVSGNVLTTLPKKGAMRVFPLSQYVCKRDAEGNLLEIIISEKISPLTFNEKTRLELFADGEYKIDEDVELYTHIYKQDDDSFYVCQEVNERKVPNSQGTYKNDQLPFQCLRMIRVASEDYGRSYVEEFIGDLKSLEGLSQALVESAAASSKVVFMIRPNAVTKKRDLALTRNGDIITGSSDDVSVLQTEKQYDLRIVADSIQNLEERMSYAFLLHTAVQRDAERVTAEEIRYMASQLETALGGVYSLLSQEFQLPLVQLLMKRMSKAKEIPALPDKSIKPTIITGVEALGRGNDLQKLTEFVGQIVGLAQVTPEIVQTINPSDLITRIATGLGIDTDGLIKSQEQIQQEQQAQQEQMMQQQMMQGGMDAAVSAAAPVANNLSKPE